MSRLDCTGYVCCKPCRPRFRRLVDHIYPADPSEGLVTNDMQKLTFYAISHPEKLDRIGEYLAYRLGRDIYRERIGYVKVWILFSGFFSMIKVLFRYRSKQWTAC